MLGLILTMASVTAPMPTCQYVYERANARYVAEGQVASGAREIPLGVVLFWDNAKDDSITALAFVVNGGLTEAGLKVFTEGGQCLTVDLQTATFYTARVPNQST